MLNLLRKKVKKGFGYNGLTTTEEKQVIKEAIKEANKEQLDLVKSYNSKCKV